MTTTHSDHFDIVLVLDYFRFGGPHLCLVQALGSRYRIGLVMVAPPERERTKAGALQDRFVASLCAAGAERITDGPYRCDLMIVQQRPYEDAAVSEVLRTVRPKRLVGLMGLAMAGLDVHERYLQQFGIRKVYVPCERFRRFLVERRNAQPLYDGVTVEQVGLPYAAVRLEPDFRADWMVAVPTGFSFRNETHKHAFLHALLRLLRQIGARDIVVYKPHNSEHRDYLAPPRYARIAQALRRVPGTATAARAAAALPGTAGRYAAKLYTALLHERVLRRCVPLRDATKRDWLPFEAFLPGLRKGVIGGLSNTIWGALYFGLPFYNCVDRTLRDSIDPGSKISQPYLDLNLEFFEVPFCRGRLDFAGARGEGIVQPQDRDGDLIAAVEADLMTAQQRTASDSVGTDEDERP